MNVLNLRRPFLVEVEQVRGKTWTRIMRFEGVAKYLMPFIESRIYARLEEGITLKAHGDNEKARDNADTLSETA